MLAVGSRISTEQAERVMAEQERTTRTILQLMYAMKATMEYVKQLSDDERQILNRLMELTGEMEREIDTVGDTISELRDEILDEEDPSCAQKEVN